MEERGVTIVLGYHYNQLQRLILQNHYHNCKPLHWTRTVISVHTLGTHLAMVCALFEVHLESRLLTSCTTTVASCLLPNFLALYSLTIYRNVPWF